MKVLRVATANEAKDSKEVSYARSRKHASEANLIYKHLGHFTDSRELLRKNDFTKCMTTEKGLEVCIAKFSVNVYRKKTSTCFLGC